MYVEDITIDGFKSYATRTVVPGFDSQFNAITGLNGSGKSNILDSICFVLGITNLSHVRAGNLQDLVYKQGQAGVTKATVSITFDNSDPDRSPAGYEHCQKLTVTRQIVIGGRNKYMINGVTAQPTRVQDLFHSVQLNVNNPHFLIMQGRIMKVLNMKPPEILSMLEEAAGTRMYETKRTNALKTLDKKDTKVAEINKVLEEEILPALEKLRKERSAYMQWVASSENLDRLRRFCIAHEFTAAKQLQDDSETQMLSLQESVEALKLDTQSMEKEAKDIHEKMGALVAEKEKQMGSELKSLSDTVDELSKGLVQATSNWTNQMDSLKDAEAAVSKLQSTAKEMEASAAKKEKEIAKVTQDNAELQATRDAAEAEAEAAEREHADVQAGKGSSQGGLEGNTFAEQLASLKNEASTAESEAKAADMKVKHVTKDLAAKNKALAANDKAAVALTKDLEDHRAAVATAQTALDGLGFDAARVETLEATVTTENLAVRELQERVDELSSQLSRVRFDYKDPEKDFDRAKVKGVVAKLLRVKEPAAATALEVLAGGKLYQVVVDSDATSKALIAKGQLRQRVTIIPLNRVNARTASDRQLAAANKAAGADAKLALSLVGFDGGVEAAMAYVFGCGFVCKDDAAAKKVAFNKDVMMNCVTLAGDLFNPSGTLTGGARAKGNSVLLRLNALVEAEEELEAHKAALAAARSELAALAADSKKHNALVKELALKSHKLTLLEERAKHSEVHQLGAAVAELEAELEAATAAGAAARTKGAEAKDKAKALEKEMQEFTSQRESRLKNAEKRLKAAKAQLAKSRDAAKDLTLQVRNLAADREAMLEEAAAASESVGAAQETVATLQGEVKTLEAKVASHKAKYDEALAALEDRRARAAACDKEVGALSKQKAKLAKKLADANVDIRKAEHKLGRMEKEAAEAEGRVAKLAADYPWIPSEEPLFGVKGGDYDWTARSAEAAVAELKELTDAHDKQSKKVNKKVLAMFDKAEGEYQELVAKRAIVEKDKEKIQQVIGELDEKKAQALHLTWEKVNKDFGSIFSTLLPGTMAKLEPPEGGSVLDGLEVRVAFGTVWKESLTELSGGQRSLLALSLILALLLFKPAPIYILDEVDAALDLSHTQNIGRMIKTHFPQSQFIVVSLKEGMFNNANIIFRTKFVDGVSTVARTVPALADRPASAPNAKGAMATKAAAKDTSKRQRRDKENAEPVA